MMRLAFDIGGTFTDFILSDDATGATQVLKIPTTPTDPSRAVIIGLQRLLEAADIPGGALDTVLHATTVATNAVLERKGALTGLITTEGFRDVLIIGRQKRYETYDLYIDKPKPLVQRRHIAEVAERIGPDGAVVMPLELPSVDAIGQRHRLQSRILQRLDIMVGVGLREDRLGEESCLHRRGTLVKISSDAGPRASSNACAITFSASGPTTPVSKSSRAFRFTGMATHCERRLGPV
jgi:hypothetical protein